MLYIPRSRFFLLQFGDLDALGWGPLRANYQHSATSILEY